MAYHPLFKERVDALIAEHERIVPPKPKRVWREEEEFDCLVGQKNSAQ